MQWSASGKLHHAENVARTESGIVMNTADLQGYKQGGATGKEWLSIVDDRSRQHHADMDGVVVGIDASFDLDDFPPSIVAHATREGRLWALPFGSSPLMWFYHRERFAAAALELPTPSWMADDFVSAALTLAEQGGEGVAGPVYGFQAFESDYVQAAGSFLRRWYDTPWIDFSTGTARPTLDSPEMVRAISQFGTLIEEQALYPLPVDLHGTTIAELGGYLELLAFHGRLQLTLQR